jgi:hypothetical protein
MLNVFVPKVCLQCPGIVTTVRQRIAARMSKHVRMRLEAKLCLSPSSLEHPGEACGGKRYSFYEQCKAPTMAQMPKAAVPTVNKGFTGH